MDEEIAYTRAAVELEADQLDRATWARAFAESDGDTQRTKARYITLRVRKLMQQETGFAQTQSNNVRQTSPVDSGHNRLAPDEKDRLWQEAQAKTLGHGIATDTTDTRGPYAAQESTTANNTAGESTQESGIDITALYKAVIGEKNTSYYLTRFEQFDQQGPGLKASWNWPALFCTYGWTLYRKMYGWTFIYFIVFLVWVLSRTGASTSAFLDWAYFAFAVVFAVFANSLYHHQVTNKISNSKPATIGYQAQFNQLSATGGVHGWVVWVAAVWIVVGVLGILAASVSPTQQPQVTASTASQQSSPNDLVKLAEQGDAQAQYQLGVAYAKGEGVSKDDAEAVTWYRKAAEQGHAKSQLNLGRRYLLGQGLPQDYGEAAHWFQKAAEQGNGVAQFTVGALYYEGKGVPTDVDKAAKWYRLAADQGVAGAQTKLGNLYLTGVGVPRDHAQAAMWLRKAADQNDAEAQAQLGFLYSLGVGVSKDYAEAATWYRKAAQQGNALGQHSLGDMYSNGRGVPQDDAEAAKWYYKAASQGSLASQVMLGTMYRDGIGVPQDNVQAYMWFSLGVIRSQAIDAKLGKHSAEVDKMFEPFSTDRFLRERETIESIMTPAQIAQAKALTRDWLAKHQQQ